MFSGDGFLLPGEAVEQADCTPSSNYSIVELQFLKNFQSSMAFFEVTVAPIGRRLPCLSLLLWLKDSQNVTSNPWKNFNPHDTCTC